MEPPFRIVPPFDVFEDGMPRIVLCLKVVLHEELPLERRKEVFGDGVVPAVALPPHTHAKAVLRQQVAIGAAGVLHAAIGMMDESRGPGRRTVIAICNALSASSASSVSLIAHPIVLRDPR
jgi:hypothetical protein